MAMSKVSMSAVILSGVNDLWACVAQPTMLGFVLAAAWKAKPLINEAGRHSFTILANRIFSEASSHQSYQVARAQYALSAVGATAHQEPSNVVSRIGGSIARQKPRNGSSYKEEI
jgi:hypothetical protein